MKRYDLELTATGPVMEEHEQGAFVPFSEVDPLNQRINQLLEERNGTGIAISNAILSGVVPDKHPLRSRLELLANHRKMLIDKSELCDDLLDLVERMVNCMGLAGEEPEEDSLNPIKEWMYDAITTMAGQRQKPSVTVTETIRTAPERIWLQVGDQQGDSNHPFPDDHEGVSWCDEQVMPCEVPYVRADLVGKVPEQHKTNWPDKCPITRRDFFMEIDGVPTYGGPYDSYTIPEMLGTPEQPWHERALFVRRFDHDEGRWVDDEIISQRVIHDDVLDALLDLKEQQAAQNDMVQHGWRLVPVEPTTQMLAAFIEAGGKAVSGYKAMLAAATESDPTKGRIITDGQELELVTVLQSIVNGFSDDPAHDAAALLKRITGEVPWTGDSFQLPPRQGGEPCALEPRSSSPA